MTIDTICIYSVYYHSKTNSEVWKERRNKKKKETSRINEILMFAFFEQMRFFPYIIYKINFTNIFYNYTQFTDCCLTVDIFKKMVNGKFDRSILLI